ncbi:uncharacterized protein [Drosophila pseudoobscura]|uniref:Uncharacterized protein n=1 Tax=Drosophila pseudoobscura pseudoobscura TaxID=46245 RepID=A0A6I8WBD7_DROPS|nr:uncharacterized protein LOC117185076 [Drosophila pseudoobscura]
MTSEQNRVSFLKLKSTEFCEKMKRLATAWQNESSDCDYYMLVVKQEQVEKLIGKFEMFHGELEELDRSEIHSGLCDIFESLASSLKAANMREMAKSSGRMPFHSTSDGGNTTVEFAGSQFLPHRRQVPSLPPIQLPTFSGGYANWTEFYSMLATIIDSDPDLTNIEKLQHLRSCLRDSALETVRALEISDGNYAVALDLLENRFNNRRLVFQAHINEILALQAVEPGSVVMLRELSDKFNSHMRALQGLGTTEQIAGCIVVQELLRKLDPPSQEKWEERFIDLAFANLIPTWESMASFLEQRCRSLETMDFSMASYASSSQVGRSRKHNNSRSTLVTMNQSVARCAL